MRAIPTISSRSSRGSPTAATWPSSGAAIPSPIDLRPRWRRRRLEWTIKALRHAPNVYLDTSGSVIDEGIVEMAARDLGVDRLLFGCDMSMTAGVARSAAPGCRPTKSGKSSAET